ncbi:HAD family hydrolase [Marinobacterium marinum]|uniref:HAD-IIB family hydrolase n=1 Tax=Marinobacterium marinum TaxID=2756129 RepID=A0A7W1WZT7_9GAMM|nr:HAD-IIB family hydrolase [Marinobacterium marinum]MBA4503259.1 HAD-IIB family hydrolase [Marinobacterium marinum]
MEQIQQLSRRQAQGIRYILTDVDDTLSYRGQLLPETLDALYALRAAGITVVPVTGACAGWCDALVRLLPVETIIGEGGGFRFQLDGLKMTTEYWLPEASREESRLQLEASVKAALAVVPRARLATDQALRFTDFAIDIGQAVQLGTEEVEQMCEVLDAFGVDYSTSSIHLNVWTGGHDKWRAAERYFTTREGLTRDQITEQVLCIGDSANDEPMFRALPISVGVANIEHSRTWLKALPTYKTAAEGGKGFAEMAQHLLSLRGGEVRLA